MGPLATALQRWRGPEFVREQVEQRGYRAHLAEFGFMRREFGAAADDLLTYWNEVARETVSSVGFGEARGARISEPGYYRSSYIDEQVRRFFEKYPGYRDGRPGARAHEVYRLLGLKRGQELSDFAAKHVQAIEAAKAAEIEAILDQVWWTGEKRQFPSLMDETAKASGFRPFDRRRSRQGYVQKGWDKTTTDGLCFEIRADLGGRVALSGRLPSYRLGLPPGERDPRQYSQIGHLPLMFSVRHVDDPEEDLYLGDYRLMFPDLWVYQSFATIEAGVLGVRALIAVMDAMSESFA